MARVTLDKLATSGAVGRALAHGKAQAASRTESGPRPLSLWADAPSAASSWAHNLRFAKATVAGLAERKWSSTALADIPGSVEARAEGVVEAAKNVGKADGALATVGAVFETLTVAEQLPLGALLGHSVPCHARGTNLGHGCRATTRPPSSAESRPAGADGPPSEHRADTSDSLCVGGREGFDQRRAGRAVWRYRRQYLVRWICPFLRDSPGVL